MHSPRILMKYHDMQNPTSNVQFAIPRKLLLMLARAVFLALSLLPALSFSLSLYLSFLPTHKGPLFEFISRSYK